jgi:hypothetical protein
VRWIEARAKARPSAAPTAISTEAASAPDTGLVAPSQLRRPKTGQEISRLVTASRGASPTPLAQVRSGETV